MSTARTTVNAAIACNIAIAIAKFVAAAVSGSAALFSEGLHSVLDTGDGLLLLLGMHLSRKPPSAGHPYGHGNEVYFWSMVVAISIFGVGGGLSIYEGVVHLDRPRAPSDPVLMYAVLAIAFAFDSISWLVSVRGFRKAEGRRGIWQAIRKTKDPTTFVIVLEDSAALVGVLVAAAGIAVASVAPAADAIASMIIGLLLVGVGIVLGRETWSLLVGESAHHEVVDSIRAIALAQPGVRGASTPRTMHFGPDVVHVDLDLDVDPHVDAIALTRTIEASVRGRHPEIQRVSVRFPG